MSQLHPAGCANVRIEPASITLTGAINLLTNAATFTGLPDIPLTNLTVSLSGGAHGLFLTTCQTPTGTATASLTDQNADRTLLVPSTFTVSGCSSSGALGGAGGTAGSTPTSIAIAGASLGSGGPGGVSTGHGKSKHKPKRRSKPGKAKRHHHPRGHR